MDALLSPEHLQLLSPSRLEAACLADASAETSDDDRLLARLARAERARRLGLYAQHRAMATRDRTSVVPNRLGGAPVRL